MAGIFRHAGAVKLDPSHYEGDGGMDTWHVPYTQGTLSNKGEHLLI